VADAGYGAATAFRDGLRARLLHYAVGVLPDTTVWAEGQGPLPPKARQQAGRPPTNLRRDAKHQPVSVKALAAALPNRSWKTVRWREGTKGRMESRFACTRVRSAHRDYKRSEPREEEWLVIEWPKGEAEPTKYSLSSLPSSTSMPELVRLIKLRWRVERDYQELKDEIGIDHYEGRGWRGFHHHGVLCIAAYAFLAAERARLSPPQPLAFLKAARVPKGFRPRGAPDAA
jgi:SRSO17 transposase